MLFDCFFVGVRLLSNVIDEFLVLFDVKLLSDGRRITIFGGFVRESFIGLDVLFEFVSLTVLASENVDADERLCSFVAVEEVSSNVLSLVMLARDDSFEVCLFLLLLDDLERCEFDKFD